jgi:hypothetical protein
MLEDQPSRNDYAVRSFEICRDTFLCRNRAGYLEISGLFRNKALFRKKYRTSKPGYYFEITSSRNRVG